MNFIPGWGDFVGLVQDVRDAFFGSTAIAKTIGFLMIIPDLGAIGAAQATQSVAKELLEKQMKKH